MLAHERERGGGGERETKRRRAKSSRRTGLLSASAAFSSAGRWLSIRARICCTLAGESAPTGGAAAWRALFPPRPTKRPPSLLARPLLPALPAPPAAALRKRLGGPAVSARERTEDGAESLPFAGPTAGVASTRLAPPSLELNSGAETELRITGRAAPPLSVSDEGDLLSDSEEGDLRTPSTPTSLLTLRNRLGGGTTTASSPPLECAPAAPAPPAVAVADAESLCCASAAAGAAAAGLSISWLFDRRKRGLLACPAASGELDASVACASSPLPPLLTVRKRDGVFVVVVVAVAVAADAIAAETAVSLLPLLLPPAAALLLLLLLLVATATPTGELL